MKIAVISSIYNNYEDLKPIVPQRDLDVEWILVSDHRPIDSLGWEVQHNIHWGKNPRYAALLPKVKPWEYTDASMSIWLDASMRIESETFVASLLNLGTNVPLMQPIHPTRDCIYKEAEAIQSRTSLSSVLDQAEFYWDEGHPEHWGLWSTKVIVRQHTPMIKKLGHLWMDEVTDWTNYLTVSEPFVLRNLRMRPEPLINMEQWLTYEPKTDRHSLGVRSLRG